MIDQEKLLGSSFYQVCINLTRESKALSLQSPNFVKVTGWKSTTLSSYEINPANITLATDMIFFHNERLALNISVPVLVQKNIFFTYKKVINEDIVYQQGNSPSNPNCFFRDAGLSIQANNRQFLLIMKHWLV